MVSLRRLSGEPPYGLRLDPDNEKFWVIDTEELATIDMIRSLHARKRSMRQIAKELNRRGITRRGGKSWTHKQVSRILVREGLHSLLSTEQQERVAYAYKEGWHDAYRRAIGLADPEAMAKKSDEDWLSSESRKDAVSS